MGIIGSQDAPEALQVEGGVGGPESLATPPPATAPLTHCRSKPPAIRKAREWKASRNQLAVLRIAILHPELKGYRSLARAAGLHYNTVKAWRRDDRFRRWWNHEMLAAARDYMGPALGELVRIISDPRSSDSVKVKACKVFFDGVQSSVEPSQASTAVLLEAFGPQSRASVAMRQGGTRSDLRIAVEAGPSPVGGSGLDAGQAVGAVEVTRHPEVAERLAIKVAEAAEVEGMRSEAQAAGKRSTGPAPIQSDVPRVLGTRPK